MSLAFPSTQWSLVQKLRDPETREDAFQALCQKYWGPVYAFLCRRFQSADAEDITQEFFFVVVRQELFERADSEQGKLRSWLLKSLHNCLSNRARSLKSLKRGGHVAIRGLEDERLRTELELIAADASSPLAAFDRAWLNSLLHNTRESLAKQYSEAGKQQLFEALLPWLVGDEESATQSDAAVRCGVSLSHFRVHLFRLRKRYAQELRHQILITLDDDEDFDDEVRRLFQVSKNGD